MPFRDDFDGHELDGSVWIAHYLPQWSSRAARAATFEVAGSELRLSIPPDQRLWCPDDHDEPLRVSAIQSGVFSGEVGSTVGQQRLRLPRQAGCRSACRACAAPGARLRLRRLTARSAGPAVRHFRLRLPVTAAANSTSLAVPDSMAVEISVDPRRLGGEQPAAG